MPYLVNPLVLIGFCLFLVYGVCWTLLKTLQVIAGIFSGSMAWWILFALIANQFRDRITDGAVLWMKRIAGFAIGGFGLVTLILSRGGPK